MFFKSKPKKSTETFIPVICLKPDDSVDHMNKMVKILKGIFGLSFYRDIIFLCIGSDRSTGDALGPIVGTMLEESGLPYRVYGTLKKPVHALNLEKTIEDIYRSTAKPLVFSVDACVGEKNRVGFIYFKKGPVLPGKAVQKNLPLVGDYTIKAVVNYVDPVTNKNLLNETRLYTVIQTAEAIVKVIKEASNRFSLNEDVLP